MVKDGASKFRLVPMLEAMAIGASIGVFFDVATFVTAGVGHGSYAPLVFGLGPIALFDKQFDSTGLLWLGAPVLWAIYGAVVTCRAGFKWRIPAVLAILLAHSVCAAISLRG